MPRNENEDYPLNVFLESLENRDIETVKRFILEDKIDVNALLDENSILGFAASHGALEISRFLVEEGAIINLPFESYPDIDPPIIESVYGGNIELVKYLIEKGADVNEIRGGNSAVEIAASEGFVEIYEYLSPLSLPRYVKSANKKLLAFQERDRTKISLSTKAANLFNHVRNSDVKAVKDLLRQHVNANAIDDRGYTPLMYAAEKGNFDISKLLLSSGANPNLIDDFSCGIPPVFFSAARGDLLLTKVLIDAGATLNTTHKGKTIFSVLLYSLSRDIPKIIDLLVEEGIDIEKTDAYGNTPLMLAKYHGRKSALNALSKHGASTINMKNIDLLIAAKQGDLSKIRVLLGSESCPDVNAQNPLGRSVLACAVLGGKLETVQLITENKANIDCPDQTGATPLMLSIIKGHAKISNFLIQSGADVNVSSFNGDTALSLIESNSALSKKDRIAIAKAIRSVLS